MSFLPALPAPGLPVFTSYQAIKCEHFIMKEGVSRDSMTVCFADNFGNAGQQFLQIEMQKHSLSFRGNGMEVMRVGIERHSMSPTEYRGMGPDGRELWTLRVKTHSFSPNEYGMPPRFLSALFSAWLTCCRLHRQLEPRPEETPR